MRGIFVNNHNLLKSVLYVNRHWSFYFFIYAPIHLHIDIAPLPLLSSLHTELAKISRTQGHAHPLARISPTSLESLHRFRLEVLPLQFRTRTLLIRTLSSFCWAFCCASSARDRDVKRQIKHFLFRSSIKDRVVEHRSDNFCITERVNSAEWEVNELTSCTIEFVALAMWECAVPRGQVGHFGNGRKRDFDGRGNDANIVVSKHCVLRLSFHWAIWIESEWVQFLPSHG